MEKTYGTASRSDMNVPRVEKDDAYLRGLVNVLWRRKWIIIAAVVVITSAVSGAVFLFRTPEYRASTELLQRRSGLDKVMLGSDVFQESGAQPDREIQTAAELVKSPEVVGAVNLELADRLGGRDAASLIEVKPVNKTDILRITATDPDPQLAADLANSFAREYIGWQQGVDKDVLVQARLPIEAQVASIPADQRESATYQVLADKLETLKLVEAMQVGNVQIVKGAITPSRPATPNLPQTTLVTFVISLFLGVGLAFTLEHFDTRIRNMDEVTMNIREPVLGVIPFDPGQNGTPVTIARPGSPGAEAYRLLKTNLSYIEPDREIRTVMITSVGPLEGKTITTANLAVTMARAGQRVTILEADLRRPKLPEYLGLENSQGITNAIVGRLSLREVLQVIDVKEKTLSQLSARKEGRRRPKPVDTGLLAGNMDAVSYNGVKPIYCATAGPTPPNPGEIVSSERFDALIEEARQYSDFVLIDTPPIGAVGDAASLASRVDGVIMVVRLSHTRKAGFEVIHDFARSIPCGILGLVITNARASSGGYYRYGGYYAGGYYNDG